MQLVQNRPEPPLHELLPAPGTVEEHDRGDATRSDTPASARWFDQGHVQLRQECFEMNWHQFEVAAPELAASWKEQLDDPGVALIGTIRRDGSPRISSIDPCIVDGELLLGMMWRSMKALDLLRDPRCVLQSPICTSTGTERELSLRGQAIEVLAPEARRRYVSVRTSWREPYLHLFSLDIESAAKIQYGDGRQSVLLWPENRSFSRLYG